MTSRVWFLSCRNAAYSDQRQMLGGSSVSVLLLTPFVLLVVLAATFVFFEGRKAYWDYRVREMCEKDGGVKVYETVKLPRDQFNQWGQINSYRPTQGEMALGAKYRFLSDIYYYRQSNPQVARSHIQVIRRSDGKLLGESISYGRGGGDFPSPSYGSGFHCPKEYGDVPLLTKTFIQTNKE